MATCSLSPAKSGFPVANWRTTMPSAAHQSWAAENRPEKDSGAAYAIVCPRRMNRIDASPRYLLRPKVAERQPQWGALADEDVGRLDIAVCDVCLVQLAQRLGDLAYRLDDLVPVRPGAIVWSRWSARLPPDTYSISSQCRLFPYPVWYGAMRNIWSSAVIRRATSTSTETLRR